MANDLIGGKPLVVEDLDVTMKVQTFIDPTYVKHWKWKAFLAFFGLHEHPRDEYARKMAEFWAKLDRGKTNGED
jgi:hypothetical protein